MITAGYHPFVRLGIVSIWSEVHTLTLISYISLLWMAGMGKPNTAERPNA